MIILSANKLKKEYGTEVIFSDVSFHVNEGDRVGLIGANGAGKTTLMKMLAGELRQDAGEIYISADTGIGYLKQNNAFDSENTVFEEIDGIFSHVHKLEKDIDELTEKIADESAKGLDVEAELHKLEDLRESFDRANGYGYKSEITGVLTSMAFDKSFYDKKISTLSGGERTRLALAVLLLKKPDLLLLDEPTNHLDIGTLKWLEQYLKGYRGTLIVISHDRYFLDRTVNRIFEMERGRLYTYEGNYSTFADKKRARREDEWRRYNSQQRDIAKQEEIIRRFKGHGTEKLAKRAASRERMLEHMERIERPEAEPGKMKLHFKQNFQSGNDVLLGEDLSKGFGYGQDRRELFHNVAFDIKRGERVCIVGANGIGKTTLLKILIGAVTPDSGYIKKGHNVDIGYYDQGQQLLNDSRTVLEEFKESYRLYSDTEMRSILGRFLFKNDDVFLKIGSLSGGERARLSLAKMMLAGTNVLILDEPTNHLDIESKEVFEEALADFPGTVIVVSHDRYFLSKMPQRILELTENGLVNYLGAYDYYVEKKQSMSSGKGYLKELSGQLSGRASGQLSGQASGQLSGQASGQLYGAVGTAGSANGTATNNTPNSSSYAKQKALVSAAPIAPNGAASGVLVGSASGETTSAQQRRMQKEKEAAERRRRREIEQLEAEIEKAEAEIKEIETKICQPENSTNPKLLQELSAELSALKEQVSQKTDRWMELQ